jgi:hypothetical protein
VKWTRFLERLQATQFEEKQHDEIGSQQRAKASGGD